MSRDPILAKGESIENMASEMVLSLVSNEDRSSVKTRLDRLLKD